MITPVLSAARQRDDASAIRGALAGLRRATSLPVAFGGTVEGHGTALRISELLGATTDSLRGLDVKHGSGLGGKAMALARPLWVGDYPNSASISHDYDGPVTAEGLVSIVAVPVVVRRRVRGVLYGALRQQLALGGRTIGAAVEAARELEQELAVRDEALRMLADLQIERAARMPEPVSLPESARWEEIRFLHAELRGLAEQVADDGLKARLLDACARLAGTADPDRPADRPPALSPRELDVLACVAIGHTNAAIAGQLGVRPETVKSYLRSAMRKLGGHTRLEAVALARRGGLLP